ncbi:MAG: class I SAM-dependent methyltransferase [Dehalococcoidales bacterium]|nr:class I SAM-dependent methyltransferase [Dehalococcoidales bacterium]
MTDPVLEKIERFSNDQYSTDARLNARIQFYRYTEKKVNFHNWLFENMDFRNVEQVVDLGCGNGQLWQKNLESIPDNIHITLSDISEGMVESAREALGVDSRFEFHVTDACSTPFESNAHQIVIANHMLYHIPDKIRIFAEIDRLMTDDGYAYASTLSSENLLELFYIADGFDKRLNFTRDDTIRNFNLENGEEILSGSFEVTDTFILRNDVITADADSLLLYLASCFENEQLELLIEKYHDFKKHVETVISDKGSLRITNRSGMFRFRKKLIT